MLPDFSAFSHSSGSASLMLWMLSKAWSAPFTLCEVPTCIHPPMRDSWDRHGHELDRRVPTQSVHAEETYQYGLQTDAFS